MKAGTIILEATVLLASLVNGQAIHSVGYGNSSSKPVVDLGYAKFQGYFNASTGINYWRGIQYICPITLDRTILY